METDSLDRYFLVRFIRSIPYKVFFFIFVSMVFGFLFILVNNNEGNLLDFKEFKASNYPDHDAYVRLTGNEGPTILYPYLTPDHVVESRLDLVDLYYDILFYGFLFFVVFYAMFYRRIFNG